MFNDHWLSMTNIRLQMINRCDVCQQIILCTESPSLPRIFFGVVHSSRWSFNQFMWNWNLKVWSLASTQQANNTNCLISKSNFPRNLFEKLLAQIKSFLLFILLLLNKIIDLMGGTDFKINCCHSGFQSADNDSKRNSMKWYEKRFSRNEAKKGNQKIVFEFSRVSQKFLVADVGVPNYVSDPVRGRRDVSIKIFFNIRSL